MSPIGGDLVIQVKPDIYQSPIGGVLVVQVTRYNQSPIGGVLVVKIKPEIIAALGILVAHQILVCFGGNQ